VASAAGTTLTGMLTLHDVSRRGFASDNGSGVLPEALEAIAAANGGHVISYGDDPYTERFQEVVRGHFGDRAIAYPVFNGTGANTVALGMLTDRWEAAICAETAHVNVDECGAPEKVAGVKLLTVPTTDGKLTPALIDRLLTGQGVEHHAQPTELGTLYSPAELRALADWAHHHGLVLHVDGARLGNAAAALGCTLRETTTDVGLDVVCLGGTKSGLMAAEAVVVLNPDAVRGPGYVRKLMGQLPSKLRFVSAQLIALYEGDLWLRAAGRANAMAARLAAGVRRMGAVRITQEPATNAVFAALPRGAAERLRSRYFFYDWDERTGDVRWVCSFDTTEEDVDGFLSALREALGSDAPATADPSEPTTPAEATGIAR